MLDDVGALVSRVSAKQTSDRVARLKRRFRADPALGGDLDLLRGATGLLDSYSYALDARCFVFQLFAPVLHGAAADAKWDAFLARGGLDVADEDVDAPPPAAAPPEDRPALSFSPRT